MKIRLGILDGNRNYLDRLSSGFSERYSDSLEIYLFTNIESARNNIRDKKIDVLLANDSFSLKPEELPQKCGFAWFVDTPGVDAIGGYPAICKFQKADLIYKQILNVYSEVAGNIDRKRMPREEETFLSVFSSPAGGVGNTTLAIAYAIHLASLGKKVFYLNLEDISSTDAYLNDEGSFSFSEVIYAIKSNKSNLSLKLESSMKHDACGVYFFAAPKTVLDMAELSKQERIMLINTLAADGGFDHVVIDTDFKTNKSCIDRRAVYKIATALFRT
ncbi:MAG: chromosome partitioning protein ParA [Lachnospiraceae bacterium]|nr:chromosome partitioning protein ParA [Lachnospiraceae bacterium]